MYYREFSKFRPFLARQIETSFFPSRQGMGISPGEILQTKVPQGRGQTTTGRSGSPRPRFAETTRKLPQQVDLAPDLAYDRESGGVVVTPLITRKESHS